MEQVKLNSITNSTDPKVVFDPKYQKSVIIKDWHPETQDDAKGKSSQIPGANVDGIRVDGVLVPIIQIDSQVIATNDVLSMRLKWTNFKPSIEVMVNKSNYLTMQTPGMVSKMTVVILPPADGTYKKISLDFYINSVKDFGNMIRYSGDFFFPDLEKVYTKSLKKNDTSKLTTYELLESIANDCQLGFAATNKCKDVKDTKTRLCRDQNLQQVIQEHISFGGDSQDIFDAWIDVYGYLVMVNLSWIMTKSVKLDELSMKELTGINLYDKGNFEENSVKYGDDTFRTFTNWETDPKMQHNKIESYEWIVNNTAIKLHGTNNTYYIVNHITTGGLNNIENENIKIEENTVDGQNFKNVYDFEKNSFIGTEMGSEVDNNTPVLLQKERRNAFMSKLQSKTLKVNLKDINVGLERGMLVNIAIYEFDRVNKVKMIQNSNNAKDGGDQTLEAGKIEDKNLEEFLNNPKLGLPNVSVSGIYFINGIEYYYDPKQKKMMQTLYLVKQTKHTNYINYSSFAKLYINNEK